MVMLHLPIGALTAIWFVEFLLEKNGDKHKNQAIGLLHLLLLLSCGLTIVLGLSYEEFGQYGDEIEEHEFWGLIFGGCVVATYLFYWINRKLGKRGSKLIYMLSLLATTITMVITAHQGGELIHGKGFLSKPFKADKRRTVATAPAEVTHESTPRKKAAPHAVTQAETTAAIIAAPEVKLRQPDISPAPPATSETTTGDASMDGMDPMMDAMSDDMMSGGMMDTMAPMAPTPPPAKADQQVALFEASQTIFQRNCYKCHGATKQKGDYRLDNKHSINLGGKSKLPAIVPGNAEDSEMMYRMLLPRDDDDVMPPEEKDPVSSEDIDTVRQWIEAGAYWPDEAELSSAPSDTIEIGDANTDDLIEAINRTGVKAEYNAWGDESVRIDLGVVEPGQLDQAIQQLGGFGNKLTWLDCSQLELPQGFFKQLQQFTKLQRLHLDGTDVTDEQLATLPQLPELSYLNLYNTSISDAGLTALHDTPSLRKVFLSQTLVTAEGIAELTTAQPELEVVYHTLAEHDAYPQP
jgi:mono/diheme cytochrome c family protein